MARDGDPIPAGVDSSAAETMAAWAVDRPGPIDDHPLVEVQRPLPHAGPGQIRLRTTACGVCRTDLHLAEGDLTPRAPLVVPGHEVVGVVDEVGPGVDRFDLGDRLGIAWLRGTCGTCPYCRRGNENLCLRPRFTGWDADGGYAPFAVVDAAYAHPIPDAFDDESAAPLLCAGIIGYRALVRARVGPGARLGIYGFGASAHLAAQVALHQGATVHVLTRAAAARRQALDLGCHSAGAADDAPPEPLDAAILFAPAGDLVPVALEALDRGGTLAIAGIHLSQIPPLDYQRHLFQEREVRSVTANTRDDANDFLRLAAQIPIEVATTPFPLREANAALAALAHDELVGAAVLHSA